ncbi:MAG: hypothetical protein JNL21_33745 [Myxococcales bacterium]|nr:hypothetical protein [Myxococcales bacterium]
MAGPDDHARVTPAVPNGKTKVAHPPDDPDYKTPSRKLIYCCFYTADPLSIAMRQYALKANKMLNEHGLGLRTSHMDVTGYKIDLERDYDNSDKHAKEIFELAKGTVALPENCLPIIFCRIGGNRPENGETFPRPTNENPKPSPSSRWILIYTNNLYSADYVTLLHEIGHAAGLDHQKWNVWNSDRRFDFMATPGDPELDKKSGFVGEDGEKKWKELVDGKLPRNTIFKHQVDKLVAAPFARRPIEIEGTMTW